MAEQEKISRVVVEDPHGNTIVDREISTVERQTVIAEHDADPNAHPYIRGIVAGAEQHSTEKVAEHNQSGQAHPYIQGLVADAQSEAESKIEQIYVGDESVVQTDQQGKKFVRFEKDQFGKVDGIKVNNVEQPIDSQGKVNIPVPTTVSELTDSNDYATKEEAQAMVDAAKVESASVEYIEDNGSPSASVVNDDGDLHFTLKNMKMKFSELTEEERQMIKGQQGIPGESAVLDPTTGNIATIEQETGNSITNPMSQKAVTDEIYNSKYWEWNKRPLPSSTISKVYIDPNGVWQSKSNNSCILLKVYPGEVLRLSRKEDITQSFSWGFLYDSNHAAGTSAVFVDDVTVPHWGSEPTVFEIPQGCEYLYIRALIGENNDGTPYVERAVKTKDKIAMVDDLQINAETESVFQWLSKPIGTQRQVIINVIGQWASGNSSNTCYTIKVKAGEILKLSKNENAETYSYALLYDDTADLNNYAELADGATEPHWESEEKIITVPEGAKYLYVRKYNGGADIVPNIYTAVKNNDKIADFNALSEGLVSLKQIDTTPYYNNEKYVNGGGIWTNGSSTNRCKFIPVTPGRLYKISMQTGTDRSYHAFFVKNNTIVVGQEVEYAGDITVVPSWRKDDQYVYAPEDAKYLYCRQRSSSEVSITPSIFECKVLKDVDRFSSERFLLQQARMANMTLDTVSGKLVRTLTPALCLLHASDLHGEGIARNAIKYAMDKYGDLIDDYLMTGDVVHYFASGSDDSTNYPNGFNWWQASGLPEKMLFTLGNHDGARKSKTSYDIVDGTAAWDGQGQEWDYDNYFAPYAEELGYVFPEGYDDPNSPYYKACYWHKDYAEQKIRLIGLDCIHKFDGILLHDGNNWTIDPYNSGMKYTSDAQEQWLIARLNETLVGGSAEGYKVVIAAHYPLDDFDGENTYWDDNQHKWVCNQNPTGGKVMVNGDKATNWHAILNPALQFDRKYTWRNRVAASNKPFAKGNVNNVGNILEDFIARGGEFIAWLCGHVHAQLMYYPSNFPNVLVIAVSQTGWYRPDGNIYRDELSHERANINFVAFHEKLDEGDTKVDPNRPRDPRRDEHLIRIVRIGCKADKALAPQNVLCYDWKRRKVISEW